MAAAADDSLLSAENAAVAEACTVRAVKILEIIERCDFETNATSGLAKEVIKFLKELLQEYLDIGDKYWNSPFQVPRSIRDDLLTLSQIPI